MNLKIFVVSFAICLVSLASSANADSNSDDAENKGFLGGVSTAVDGAHENVNSRFKNFVSQVDGFIGTEQDGEYINDSWARIRLDTIKTDEGDIEVKAKIKLRLVLPQSQQRFRLLLSSGDDDQSVAGTDAAQREQLEKEDENVALALRFLRNVREQSSVKFDVGARWRDDTVQVFGRLGAVVQRPLGGEWSFTTSNDLYHYSESGYENRLRFDFRRLLFESNRLYLHNSTEIRWLEGQKGASIGGISGIYADRGPKAAYAFEVLANATTSLREGSDDYYQGTELRLRIRRNAFRPWLFFEIWPSVSWSASNNFDQAYAGRIRVEMNFGR